MELQARPKRSIYNARIPVYNPVNRPRTVGVFGTLYDFEPRGGARCICAEHVASEDREGIHAAFDWPRDDLNRLMTNVPRLEIRTALQVAEHIVSPEMMGGLGFVILEGTVEEQEQQKREANARYAQFRRAEVDDLIAGWESLCAAHRQAQPGEPPPKRPKNIQEAYKDRDLLEKGEERAAFICPACSEEKDRMEEMAAHMKKAHPGLVGVAPIDMAPRPVEVAPLNRTQPSQVRKGLEIIEKAKAAGLELSLAERKCLEHGESDVLFDVIDRLHALKNPAPVAAATMPNDGPPAEPLEPGPDQPDDGPEPENEVSAAVPAVLQSSPPSTRASRSQLAKAAKDAKEKEPVAAGG